MKYITKTEIRNDSDKTISLILNEPIRVLSFPDNHKKHFDFYHIDRTFFAPKF